MLPFLERGREACPRDPAGRKEVKQESSRVEKCRFNGGFILILGRRNLRSICRSKLQGINRGLIADSSTAV